MAQIKKDTSLRKAILQAAITGQLVSNVEGESLPLAPASKLSSATPSAGASPATPPETGKELLDRIIEERNNKLLAEWEEAKKTNPKAKKPAPIVPCEIAEEEIPFEIPENWCWCRLKDIFFMQAGKTISSSKIFEIRSDENPYPCFGGNGLRGFVSNYNKEGSYPIIGRQGALCGCINIATGKFYATEHAVVVDCFDICNYQWASWFLIALNLNQYATATAQPGLAVNKIETVLIPLPPLAVQNAIVAKLEQVLPLVDAYENALLQKEELKNALPDKVKKAILQEAITGQLTEAWRKTATIKESGKQLLDRIIEERNAKALAEWEEALKKNPKAKKPVPVVATEIDEEEIPFEVPENWCWCRLGDICYKIGDIDHKMPKDVIDGIPYISPKDFTEDNIDFLNAKKISQEDFDDLSKKMKPQKGDIIFPRYGTIGIVRLVNVDFNFLVSYSCCTISTMKNLVSEYYIFYMLQSAHIKDEIDKYINKTTQPNVGLESIKHFLIPLPPIEEQKHIVEKIEQLLSLCGELK